MLFYTRKMVSITGRASLFRSVFVHAKATLAYSQNEYYGCHRSVLTAQNLVLSMRVFGPRNAAYAVNLTYYRHTEKVHVPKTTLLRENCSNSQTSHILAVFR